MVSTGWITYHILCKFKLKDKGRILSTITKKQKGGIRPVVMVKDLTQLTVKDLWKEVKSEEDW